MQDLIFDFKNLCKKNKNGSHATQLKRYRELKLIATTLRTLGFRQMRAKSLKSKHIDRLVEHWKENEISIGTMKQRMTVLRWWASKVGLERMIASSNDHYGIGKREYVTDYSKAVYLTDEIIHTINDPYILASLRLSQLFGLRKEESIKFNPVYADKGDYILLKGSWCKGGRQRAVPILNDAQRQFIDELKQLVGANALIPPDKTFVQQYKHYDEVIHPFGLRKMHGLRHAYAQERYQQLTGWPCVHNGGKKIIDMTKAEKDIDKEARRSIARELGHNRINVVSVYIGKK